MTALEQTSRCDLGASCLGNWQDSAIAFAGASASDAWETLGGRVLALSQGGQART